MIEIIPRFNSKQFTERFKQYKNAKSYEHLGLSFIMEKESKYDGQIQSSLFMNLMSNKVSIAEVQYAYVISCTIGQLADMIERSRFEHDAIYDMISEIRKYGTYNCQRLINLDLMEERNVIDYDYNMPTNHSTTESRYFNIIDSNILFIDKADSIKDISEEGRLKSAFVTFEFIDWDNIIHEYATANSVITYECDVKDINENTRYGLSRDDERTVRVYNSYNGEANVCVIDITASSYELRQLSDMIADIPHIADTINKVKKYVITDNIYNIMNSKSKHESIQELKRILLEEYIGVVNDDSDNSIAYYKENFDFNRAINKDDEPDFDPNTIGSID